MAVYSVGRRRIIVVLLLSSVLLLTLDLRGNAVLDRVRDAFAVAMTPVEIAADVVTSPVERALESYTNYDDLERENEALRDRLARIEGSQAAAEAAIIDSQKIRELNELPSLAGIPTAVAEVVGASANNIDQIVEINKGSLAGVRVGQPVVNQAGLVGRVTSVTPTSAQVMLATDRRFTIAVEIFGGTGAAGDPFAPLDTTLSGLTEEQIDELTSPTTVPDAGDDAAPATTNPLDVFGDDDLPQNPLSPTVTTTIPVDPDAEPTVTTTPPTTAPLRPEDLPPAIPADGSPVQVRPQTPVAGPEPISPSSVEKEFGALVGDGQGKLPKVRLLQDNPSLSILQEGDLVATAGGSGSLAPPDIPVGRVINRINRPGVGGPILEVELAADLEQLGFVRVVLFQPAEEAG